MATSTRASAGNAGSEEPVELGHVRGLRPVRQDQGLGSWKIHAVQVASLPKAKRVRAGLEHCHRASVLLLNDDSVVIESELIKESQAPRERFFA